MLERALIGVSTDARATPDLHLALETSPEQIFDSLCSALDRESCDWIGGVNGNCFEIRSRDPWTPVLRGQLSVTAGGCDLVATFREEPFHRQFRLVVLCALSLFAFGGLLFMCHGHGGDPVALLRAFAIVGMVAGLFVLLFETGEAIVASGAERVREPCLDFVRACLRAASTR